MTHTPLPSNKKGFIILVAILALIAALLFWPKKAGAQDNLAAVRIADAAQPTVLLMEAAMKCAESRDKDTRKFCLELVKLEMKRGNKVANEAADATKNNWPRPIVVNPYDLRGVNTIVDPRPGGAGWVTPYGGR